MKATLPLSAALLLAIPVMGASAQTKTQDILTPAPPPGWERPDATQTGGPGAELEAGEMGMGRHYGSPAGNALVTPNNAAAIAARADSSREPGLNVQLDMLGTQDSAVADGVRPPAPANYRLVDEPSMRQLNDAGTGATNAKIGVGERTTDDTADVGVESDPDDQFPIAGGLSSERVTIASAGDPVPIKPSAGLTGLPPHPNPSK